MDTTNWKWFRYDEIFDIKKGKRLTSFDQEAGDIPYIGAIDSNNGVSAYVANDKYLHAGNTISVSYNGSIGQAYYQDQPFWATDDVNVFYPKYKFNKYIAFFILPLIEKEKYRFCYGRKWTSESMRSSRMPLPIMKEGTPDWQYMEDYVKNAIIPQLPEQVRAVWMQTYDTHPVASNKLKLDLQNWKQFRYDEIFDIKHGFYNKKPDDNPQGNIPFIGATDSNNGVTSYTDMETIEVTTQTGNGKNAPIEEKIFSNCIAVTNDGSVGYAYYQPNTFTCSHSVTPLYLKDHELNKYIALFLCTIIEQERFRWAYGRKWRPTRMPSSIIKLPVTKDGIPDWQFMEDYIKSLPYSKNI